MIDELKLLRPPRKSRLIYDNKSSSIMATVHTDKLRHLIISRSRRRSIALNTPSFHFRWLTYRLPLLA